MIATLFASALCFSANTTPNRPTARDSERETLLNPNPSAARVSTFAPIAQAGMEGTCTNFRPPRLVTAIGEAFAPPKAKIALDLVVGTDGYVESFLILETPNEAMEHNVADRVSRWVYKPALCNGVPVAVEGKIEIQAE